MQPIAGNFVAVNMIRREMKKDITIYDLARELNISATTVSRALNDHPAVNKNTRKKIFDRATEMGYRNNMFATNLRKQCTNTIGLIVPRLNSSFMSSVIAGIEKVANEAGYNLIISQSLETVKKEIENAKTMFNNRVDGLLVSLAYDTENIDHLEIFINKGIPLLFFDRVFDNKHCTSVVIDNIKAGYAATKHLIEQNCTSIVHITGNLKRNVYADRLKGYKYALLDHNLDLKDTLILETNLSEEAGTNAAEQILKMDPLPDGIFVANDMCAVSCMKALKKAGIKIPQDIAIVGFNNDPICRVVEPNLSTIDYPGYEMGETTAMSLINYLKSGSTINSTNSIILRSELIIRESSQKK